MTNKLLAVGSIVEDTAEPENIIGGGVSYSGITAAKGFDYDVTIVTKLPPGHRFIAEFKKKGINVVLSPNTTDSVITFTNTYDEHGKRTQKAAGKSEIITIADLETIDKNLLNGSLFLVAPVISEVDTKVIPHLAQYGMVLVTPQGYFRDRREDGTVVQCDWTKFENDLTHAAVTIFSEEDIARDNGLDERLLKRICACSKIVVLTRGEKGQTLFIQNTEPVRIYAFPLKKHELHDITGAGDTYAAAFIARYAQTRDPHEAAVLASLYAAVKIVNNGTGVETIPTMLRFSEFVVQNQIQVKDFLKSNNFHKPLRLI